MDLNVWRLARTYGGYWRRAVPTLAAHATDRQFLAALASSAKAPEVFMLALYPEIKEIEVEMGTIRFRPSNQDPLEQFFLAAYSRLRNPRNIFEIGTYDGSTTLLLARNAPDAQIFTLDLPPEAAPLATVRGEAQHAASGQTGSAFVGTPEEARIEQLYGDSRTFNFEAWAGSIDLVIVDGGHTYECVAADTATAQRLLAPAGTIVWDDYEPVWPDVVHAVDETGLPVTQIKHTGLAVLDTGK
jgi:predicted O-methyltransferase YrrM